MAINLEQLGFKQHDDADFPQLSYENSMGRYILNAMKVQKGYWIIIWHMGNDGIYAQMNIGCFSDQETLSRFIETVKTL